MKLPIFISFFHAFAYNMKIKVTMKGLGILLICFCVVGCSESERKPSSKELVQEWAFIDNVQVGKLNSVYDRKLGRWAEYGLNGKDTLWVTKTSTLRKYKLSGTQYKSTLRRWQNTNTTYPVNR